MNDRIQIYRDRSRQWRWRRVAGNGRLVSESGEGYVTKWGVKRAAKRSNPGSPIVRVNSE